MNQDDGILDSLHYAPDIYVWLKFSIVKFRCDLLPLSLIRVAATKIKDNLK